MFETTENQTTTEESHSGTVYLVLLIVLQILIALCIVFGNGMVLIAAYKFVHLRTASHIFLFNLAVADLLAGLVAIPVKITSQLLTEKIHYLYWLCLVKYYPYGITISASVTLLLGMTVDRYIAVHRPLHYHQIMTKQRAIRCAATCWVYCLGIYSIEGAVYASTNRPTVCESLYIFSKPFVLFNISMLSLSIIIITLIYIKILFTIHKSGLFQRDTVRQSTRLPLSERSSTANVKAAKTAVIIVGCFCLCVLPFTVIDGIMVMKKDTDMFYNNESLYNAAKFFGGIMLILNSLMNPIIYNFRVPAFKRAFRRILHLRETSSHVPNGTLQLNTVSRPRLTYSETISDCHD